MNMKKNIYFYLLYLIIIFFALFLYNKYPDYFALLISVTLIPLILYIGFKYYVFLLLIIPTNLIFSSIPNLYILERDIHGFSLPIFGIFQVMFCIIALIKIVELRKKRHRNKIRIMDITGIKPYLLFLIILLFGLLMTEGWKKTGALSQWLMWLNMLIMYIYIVHYFDVKKFLPTLVSVCVLSSLIPIGYMLIQYWMNIGHLSSVEEFYALYSNPFGWRAHLAYFLATLFPVTVVLSFNSYDSSKYQKSFFYSIISILALLVIYFTFIRGVLVTVLISIIVVVFFYRKKLLFPLILGIALLVLIPATTFRFAEFAGGIDLNNPALASNRLFIWQNLWNVVIRKPFTGYGLGSFYSISKGISAIQYSAHCDFLYILIESGIIGLIPLILFYYLLFKKAIKSAMVTKNRYTKALLIGFIGALCVHLLGGLIDNLLFMYDARLLLFCFAAIAYICERSVIEEKKGAFSLSDK
ncbi:hypothetical protein ES705_07470 [subsurface metagenome]